MSGSVIIRSLIATGAIAIFYAVFATFSNNHPLDKAFSNPDSLVGLNRQQVVKTLTVQPDQKTEDSWIFFERESRMTLQSLLPLDISPFLILKFDEFDIVQKAYIAD